MKATKYRFYLSVDEGLTMRESLPVYKGDLSLEYELESGQYFHRASLSGKIDFVGDDYDWIIAQPFESLYHIYIQVSHDNGVTFANYWHGTFARTDCEVNEDDKKVVVQPQVRDRYTKVLGGMEREYDLIRDLNPNRTNIESTKRGYWQLYQADNGQAQNVYENDVIAEDVENELSEAQLQASGGGAYKFTCAQMMTYTRVAKAKDGQGELPSIDCEGLYVGYVIPVPASDTLPAIYWDTWLVNEEKGYAIKIYQRVLAGNPSFTTEDCEFYDSKGTLLYKAETQYQARAYSRQYPRRKYTLLAESGMTGKITLDGFTMVVYGRYVCNTESDSIEVYGNTISVADKPQTDLTITNLNYTRIFQCGVNVYTQGNIYISARTTTQQSKWGDNDGVYWLPPTDDAEYLPLYQREWVQGISYWVKPLSDDIGNKAQATYNMPDTFPISAVIEALLLKIDPSITHKETTQYSEFLYGAINPISGIQQRLYITPKSNAIVSDYSMAARKGTITLKMVLDMLCKVFRLYWYIDEDNRLRIEHLKWWEQGKSYIADAWQTGADLTTLQNTRNGKMWDYGKSSYTFNKEDMPERITFAWMDDVSAVFDGQPIVLQSNLVEQGKKEEQSISNFTSDLGYLLLGGTDVTKDGFALIGAWNKNAMGRIGQTYHFAGGYTLFPLWGDREQWSVQITAEFKSASAEVLEYGIYDNDTSTFEVLGEIPCDVTAAEYTIQLQSPARNWNLAFHSQNGVTCEMKVLSITGGQWEVPVITNYDEYNYPVPDMQPLHAEGTTTANVSILTIQFPSYIPNLMTPSRQMTIRMNVTECTGGKIQDFYGTLYGVGTHTFEVTYGTGSTDLYFELANGATEGTYAVQIEAVEYESEYTTNIANYYLSLEYLLPTYWAYGLPVAMASFNGEPAVMTTNVAKGRQQTAKLPMGAQNDIDVEKLIKTGVGLGRISKMSVNLSSRVATLTLKHDIQ